MTPELAHASASNPDEFHGQIRAGSALERAVRLAGVLAEQGVCSITMEQDGRACELCARATDLPGLLVGNPHRGPHSSVLRAHDLELHVERDIVTWVTRRASLAEALRALP